MPPSADDPVGSNPIEAVSSSPSLVTLPDLSNVTDLVMQRLHAAPDHVAFETPAASGDPDNAEGGAWRPVTTREFVEQVSAWAKGLIATGVEQGDAVLIAAPTQYRWAVADFAALFVGAVVVPIYETSVDAHIEAVLADMRPAAAFVGDGALGERVVAAADRADLSIRVWVLDDEVDDATDDATDGATQNLTATTATTTPAAGDPSAVQGVSELVRGGAEVSDDELEHHRRSATLDDVATVVYTSGTTGEPKGALITHRNLAGQVLNTAAAYREVVRESGNTILFLPLTHVLGRALQLICVSEGMRVAHLSNPKDVVAALRVLRPTFLVVVPRVLEKIQAAAETSAREKRLSAVWSTAARTAVEWGAHLEERDRDPGARPGRALRIRHAFFDRLFYGRLRAVMGGRLEYLLSGAATLHPELALFFRGIGVPVIEGYGLTETTAPLVGGRPGELRAGSVGRPLPGNSVAIGPGGEVLARGIGVFSGYRDPEHTAAAFVDGYFRTGDLGALDEDGALTLLGRAKNVIITSTGRTVSPERWEQSVEAHPWVAHAMLVGTDRPYLTGIVVVDTEALASTPHALPEPTGTELGILDLAADSVVHDEIERTVALANATRSPGDRAQHWRAIVLPGEGPERFITPTMKLRRGALLDAGAPMIDELYSAAASPRRRDTIRKGN